MIFTGNSKLSPTYEDVLERMSQRWGISPCVFEEVPIGSVSKLESATRLAVKRGITPFHRIRNFVKILIGCDSTV